MAASKTGRFTTGSTMRHVAVMTVTGSLGLSFMFLVDFATLFYVSLLGDEALTAGVGFAWALQFFNVSVGIGVAIAALALVSRAIGAREPARARSHATSAMLFAVILLLAVAGVMVTIRHEVLALIGAQGEAATVAARFLLISVPSLPFVGVGMVASSILRAEGDAKRAMLVTMTSGATAMVLAPLLIFGFDLGVDGAAIDMVLSRAVSSSVGLWFCVGKSLCAQPSLRDAKKFVGPFFAIAGPATATQLSTPLGNILLTWWIADFGDSAPGGWGGASGLTVLAFGGIFALSGAIGGIIGQNYGARLAPRVASAYRDSLIFASGYVIATWALLAAFAPLIVRGFGVSEAGASVVYAFCYIGAGGFMFNGALFVANAAFNNLGRPLWSTGFNWFRDAAVTPLALTLIPVTAGPSGVVYAQAFAGVIVGSAAVAVGWRLSHRIRFKPEEGAEWTAGAMAPTSARGAAALLHATERAAPAPESASGARPRHGLDSDAETNN
ncbi:MAG: MATE family efflux transporter [Paracoccaceae bacterium]